VGASNLLLKRSIRAEHCIVTILVWWLLIAKFLLSVVAVSIVFCDTVIMYC